MMILSMRIAIATALMTSTTFADNHGEDEVVYMQPVYQAYTIQCAHPSEDDNACDATKCIKNDILTGFVDAADPFCCAGVSGTKCSDGYHYSVGGDCYQGIAFATCCTKDPVPLQGHPPNSSTYTGVDVVVEGRDEGSGEAASAFDYSECTESECTSPDGWGTGGYDCYAGSYSEPCSCGAGLSAKTTGETFFYNSQTYFAYTCCTVHNSTDDAGRTDGETCGDYNPLIGKIIGYVIGGIFGVCALGAACVFGCFYVAATSTSTSPWSSRHTRPTASFHNPVTGQQVYNNQSSQRAFMENGMQEATMSTATATSVAGGGIQASGKQYDSLGGGQHQANPYAAGAPPAYN